MERACACALGHIFGFEPKYAVKIIETFGSARAVFSLGASGLDALLGRESKYSGRICRKAVEDAAEELESLSGMGCHFISCTEDCFPKALAECEDHPAGLYVRSATPPEAVFNRRPAIAVVGTRDISPYGREWTVRIVEALSHAPRKPAIISGLAFGVDINAHLAALDNGLPTIAVLPTGMDRIYPRAHAAVAERIAACEGCALVSDYPPGTAPAANTFLRRNRIIAGIASATILTESKIHGGGLMTCRLASGYGRDVYVLPGRIDDYRSEGCNRLLHEKVAEPVFNLRTLGEDLGLGSPAIGRKEDLAARLEGFYSHRPEDAGALCAMAELVRRRRGATIDELCRETGKDYAETARLVNILESDRFIDIDLLQRCTINLKNM